MRSQEGTYTETLGQMIKKYRTDHNYTLREFGKMIPASWETLRKLENDQYLISFDMLENICKIMNLDFDEAIKHIRVRIIHNEKIYYHTIAAKQ